jgi:ABC-type glycerol-3-phosphate transport system substrate-binding protein
MKMPNLKTLSPSQIFIVLIGIGIVIVLSVLIFFNIRQNPDSEVASVVVWGFEPKTFFEGPLDAFEKSHPNITISYRQVPAADYRDTLLNALAAGEGPDVFMFKNSWLLKNKSKVTPLPPTQMSLVDFEALYPQVASQDFVSDGSIFALPLYLDTLSLIYNKNLFDQTSITRTPANWQELKTVVEALRIVGANNQVMRAGAAIGGSSQTIDGAADLLQCMMLQNSSLTTGARGANGNIFTEQGRIASDLYLQFANPVSPFYTWNESLLNSLESFASEKTAIIFNYKSAVDVVVKKNPFLNYGVAPLPQFSQSGQTVSCSNYWGLAVSKQASNAKWAWNVALLLAADPTANSNYLTQSGHPPALRSLIATRLNDPAWSVFARQALTARSWPTPDDVQVDGFVNTFIRNVLSGHVSFANGFDQLRNQVQKLLRDGQ